MSIEIANLVTKFSGDTKDLDKAFNRVEHGINQVLLRLKALDSKLDETSRGLKGLSESSISQSFISGLGKATLALAAAGIALEGLKQSVDAAASFDSLKRGLVAVTGSADEAERQIARLREAAKAPGLGFEQAIEGSLRLQAAGLSAELAEKAVKEFGNALALVGKGKGELDGVFLALTQIASKSKVSAEEINQLAERLPQIRKLMQSAFGTADTEAIQKQGVTPLEFITGIIAELEKTERATSGAKNAFDNFDDALKQLKVTVGTPFLTPLTYVIESLNTHLENTSGVIENLLSGKIKSVDPSKLVNALFPPLALGKAIGKQLIEAMGFAVTEGDFGLPIPLEMTLTGNSKFRSPLSNITKAIESLNSASLSSVTTESEDLKKSLEKTQSVLTDITSKLREFGGQSEEAATKQKLLSIEADGVNVKYAEQAIQLARLLDVFKNQKEEADKAFDSQLKWQETIQDLNKQLRGFVTSAKESIASISDPSKLGEFNRWLTKTETQFNTTFDPSVVASVRLELESLDKVAALSRLAEQFKSVEKSLPDFLRSIHQGLTGEIEKLEGKTSPMDELVRTLSGGFEKALAGLEGEGEIGKLTNQMGTLTGAFERVKTLYGTSFTGQGFFSGTERDALAIEILTNAFNALGIAGDKLGKTNVEQIIQQLISIFKSGGDAKGLHTQFDTVKEYTTLLKQLEDELQKDANLTAEQTLQKTLLAEAYKNLTKEEKDNLLAKAKQIDVNTGLKQFADLQSTLQGELSKDAKVTERARLEKLLLTEQYKLLTEAQRAYLLGLASAIDAQEIYSKTFGGKFAAFKKDIPSIGDSLEDSFFRSLDAISTSLGQNLTNWQGGFKEMFKGIGLDFAQLMREVAAALIKVLILQAIMKLFGSIFGGFLGGGGGTPGAGIGHELGGNFPGFAEGGRPTVGEWAVVGEEGEELVKFNRPATVYSHNDSLNILRSMNDGYKQTKEAWNSPSFVQGGGMNMTNSNNSSTSNVTNVTNNIHVTNSFPQRQSNMAPPSERQIADKLASIVLPHLVKKLGR